MHWPGVCIWGLGCYALCCVELGGICGRELGWMATQWTGVCVCVLDWIFVSCIALAWTTVYICEYREVSLAIMDCVALGRVCWTGLVYLCEYGSELGYPPGIGVLC